MRQNAALWGNGLNSNPHDIASKPLAAFSHNHCRNNGTHPNCIIITDKDMQKNDKALSKQVGNRNNEDILSGKGDSVLFETESCDNKHTVSSKQQHFGGQLTCQYQTWGGQPDVVFNSECDGEIRGTEFQCSKPDYGTVENCEQKWFDDLAQYGDSLTRPFYGSYSSEPCTQLRDCSWESDCNRTEFRYRSTCMELPPVTEILPKAGENLYIIETPAFGYGVTDTQFSSCSVNSNKRNFRSCMVQSRSGSRMNISNFHSNKTDGFFRPPQSEVTVSTRNRNKGKVLN